MTVTDIDRSLETKLLKALTELPPAYNQLHLFALPGSRPSPEDGRAPKRGKLSTRSPLDEVVLDLLDRRHKADVEPTRDNYELDRVAGQRRLGILPTLRQWVTLIDCELWDGGHEHGAPHDQPTIHTECAWLQRHVEWILQQRWALDLVDDLTRMLKDCTLITGTGTDVIKMTCTNVRCGFPVIELYGGTVYHCTGCGQDWGRLELHRMAERKKPKPLDECANLAGLHIRTLRRYVADGRIKHVARDGALLLYDIDAVMKATMDQRYKETA